MKTVITAILAAALITAIPAWSTEPQPAASAQPATKGLRIFSLVHSMAGRFLDTCLGQIARSAGYTGHTQLGQDGVGRSKVMQHWNRPGVQEIIQSGSVDVLISMGVYPPDPGPEMFAELGAKSNPNFRMTFMEMWIPFDVYEPGFFTGQNPLPSPKGVDHDAVPFEQLRKDSTRYWQEWDDLINGVNKKLGGQVVFVVPAGQAALKLRELIIAGKAPGLTSQNDIFKRDGTGRAGPHPDLPLATLMSYCHYAVIYRKSPVGLPVPEAFKLSRNSKNDDPKTLEALNHLLQELAWDAVIHHPLSGVKAETAVPAAK